MDNYGMTQQVIVRVRERLAKKIDEVFEWGGLSELVRVMNRSGTKITQQNISKFILHGKRIPGWLPDAATALGVTVEWLRYGTGQKQDIQYEQRTITKRSLTERIYTHADLEMIYKCISANERAKFDAIYPLIKKEMAEDQIEEVADDGLAQVAKGNGKKN